jgi:alkylation response protein AidB-like acyl-CoA dehydrogenase
VTIVQLALSETQTMLQDTANRLLRDRHSFEQRNKILAGHAGGLWNEFAELGLLGVEIGGDCGGADGSFADLAVVLEAMGRHLVVEPFLSTAVLGAGLIAEGTSGDTRAELLQAIAEGRLKVALAHGEPRARYVLAHVETRARRIGSGFSIDGAKSMVLGANDADQLIVSARTSGATADADGVSLFLVDAKTAGVTLRPVRMIDDRGAAEITLNSVQVPADALLGPPDGALPLVERAYDRGAAAVCCETVGAMTAANETTLEYLKTRVQFGRPIGKFQALQHRMADMAMAEELARSMSFLVASAADESDAAARAHAISACKVQISEAGRTVGHGAVQLHGGIGMTMEYVIGHYLRRIVAAEKLFGDVDHHLNRFADHL